MWIFGLLEKCGYSREQPMGRLRILVAGDHTLLAETFVKLLEPKDDVVGTAADGRELLTEAERLNPDISLNWHL